MSRLKVLLLLLAIVVVLAATVFVGWLLWPDAKRVLGPTLGPKLHELTDTLAFWRPKEQLPPTIPGKSWARVPAKYALIAETGEAYTMVDVVVHTGTLVAIGLHRDEAGADTLTSWTSSDGLEWTRHDTGITSGIQGNQRLDVDIDGTFELRLASDGTRLIAQYGFEQWTSSDGVAWREAPALRDEVLAQYRDSTDATEQVRIKSLYDIDAWAGRQFISVGEGGIFGRNELPIPIATSRVSTSGAQWLSAPLEADAAATMAGLMRSVTRYQTRWIAVGSRVDSSNPSAFDAAAWHSTNGLDWTSVVDPGLRDADDDRLVDVASTDVALIALQTHARARDVTATDDALSSTIVRRSVSGETWTAAPLSDDAGSLAQALRLGHASRGYFALGRVISGDREVPAVWHSQDGISWAEIRIGEPLLRASAPRLRGGTAFGTGYVAVGSNGTDAAVWVSGILPAEK